MNVGDNQSRTCEKLDVLSNMHNPAHGATAADVPAIEDRIEILRKRFLE